MKKSTPPLLKSKERTLIESIQRFFIVPNKTILLLTILLSLSPFLFAYQHPPDSLLIKDYSYLKKKVYSNATDSIVAIPYVQAYLYKAKTEKDTFKIVDGFYFSSGIIQDEKISEKYVDSMLLFSKNLTTKKYPAFAYHCKASIEYDKGYFKKAFDLFLKTNEAAEKYGNTNLFYASKKSIGILKSRIGENETALKAFKECLNYYESNKSTKPWYYLITLFALSDSYNLNKKLDSATIINRLGYKESILFKNEPFKYYFTLNEGINQYDKKNYIAAKDSLSKALEEFNTNGDTGNLSMGYFFYGKTLTALGEKDKAINAHIKVDSIFQEIAMIMPNNRENYEILIEHYKKKGDQDNQLKYIERLIAVDSTLHTNYRYLIKNVVQNYDTPRLLAEKQEIIDNLEQGSQKSYTIIIVLLIISTLLFMLWIINHYKQKRYKKRFESLYNKQNITNTVNKPIISEEKISLNIPKESIEDILKSLDAFETKQEYLKSNLSIHILAKGFGTNSKYLSKVINTYKKKSFNYYINDLRIDHTVNRLKSDSKFRNYTIKAIAREVGFNTTDAFSKAFYKRNGIHPSYFIKELEKQTNN